LKGLNPSRKLNLGHLSGIGAVQWFDLGVMNLVAVLPAAVEKPGVLTSKVHQIAGGSADLLADPSHAPLETVDLPGLDAESVSARKHQ